MLSRFMKFYLSKKLESLLYGRTLTMLFSVVYMLMQAVVVMLLLFFMLAVNKKKHVWHYGQQPYHLYLILRKQAKLKFRKLVLFGKLRARNN